MNKVTVTDHELQNLNYGTEMMVRLLLHSKGMPMKGLFSKELDLENYTYEMYRDVERSETIYSWEKIGEKDEKER